MKLLPKLIATTMTLSVLITAALRAQSVDGFDPNANDLISVVVVQPNGKILIGGQFTTLSPNGGAAVTRNLIARLNQDGTLDAAFDPNTNGTQVTAITVQTDGKILVSGFFTNIGGQARNNLARLDAGTGLADSFNPSAPGPIYSIAEQADGKILVGGDFTGSIGGQTRNFIARLDATSGAADSLDPNSNGPVYSMAVQSDGKILVGGGFTNIGAQPRSGIARIDPTTGLADSFDPNTIGTQVGTIAVQTDGKILVGGNFTTIGGQTRHRIARLDATTGLADSFDPNANGRVNTVVVQADGKVLAGGSFSGPNSIGGQTRNHIARLDATTGLADSFDPNADDLVNSIALQADTKVLVGGQFSSIGGQTRNRIARLISATATPPVITSPLVATGTVGLPFIYQFTAIGATSLNIPGGVAPGLTFNGNLAAITGIPTTAGIVPVGLSATNSNGTTNATLTITVQPTPASGPIIVSSTCATGRTGRPFSFQLQTSGGSSATRFAVDGLPPGFSLDPVTGFISGVPTANGSSSLAVSAIDGASTTHATLQLTFTSDPAVPILTSAATAILTPGQPFIYTMTADANGVFGYIGTDGIVHQAPSPSCAGLPAGLCFDGDHTISGTYNPPFGRDGGFERVPNLSGGIVTNVQLFATDPSGTGTFPLIGFIATPGTVQISTRLTVGTGDNVLIGGFIIVGTGTTRVLIRAIGPSLAPGVPNVLADPILELREGGTLLASNDNWEDTQGYPIRDTQVPPTNNLESAILAFLSPGAYTATVRGQNSTTGNAVVEVYDLGIAAFEPRGDARLANISTRGTVLTGDNVIIGGFFVRPEAPATSTRVVVRAIGPSLPVPGALGDPTLELHDSNGGLIDANDNWRSDHEAEIIATTIPPSNDLESAIVRNLMPGPYTAIVQGSGGTTGVALVEVYSLQ